MCIPVRTALILILIIHFDDKDAKPKEYTCGGKAVSLADTKAKLDKLIANDKWLVGYDGTGGKCPGTNWWFNGGSRCFKLLGLKMASGWDNVPPYGRYTFDMAEKKCKEETDTRWGLKAGDARLLKFQEDEDFTMLYWAVVNPRINDNKVAIG